MDKNKITSIVDETMFALRRKGTDWAKNIAVLMAWFCDVESFVSSIAGYRNLKRTKSFEIRQQDECKFENTIFASSLTWEAGEASGKGLSLLCEDFEQVLQTKGAADPQLLLQIARTGDTVGVRQLLCSKCDLMQAKTPKEFNALHACAYGGFTDTAKAILEKHSSQEYLDSWKMPEQITPLFFAAQFGHEDAARLLLKCRASVNLGQTPVYEAAQKGHKSIVEMFISAGANFNATPEDGYTPLFIAAQFGKTDIVATLIKVGASVNTPMLDGMTPIYIAANQGHKEVVSLLVQAGANVNQPGKEGQTPMQTAVEKGYDAVVTVLKQAG